MSLGWIEYGPESSGVRTQFLKRMVDFADGIGQDGPTALLPAMSQQVQPGRTVSGHLGAALERCQAGGCRNHAGEGGEHGVERYQEGIHLFPGILS